MRVLVTGAAGLIGSSIAARLALRHDVIGLDLRPGPWVGLVADLLEAHRLRQAIGVIDAVIHVAALHAPHVGRLDDQQFRKVNVEGTRRLLELAQVAGASHFVLTSTTSLYGHALQGSGSAVWIDEATSPVPRDIYDETKLDSERLLTSAGEELTVTALRMSRCFPEEAGAMAWYRLHRGVDRRDVADAHALALERSGPPATYVISAMTPFQRADLRSLQVCAPSVIERRCPGLIDAMAAKGWAPPPRIDRVYDCSLAMRELGYRPHHGVESCLAGDWDPLPSR